MRTLGNGLSDSADGQEEEKIEVVRIRLFQPSMQLAAILGEFRAADRLLDTWLKCAPQPCTCEFELTFKDGYRLQGSYLFCANKRHHPSLGRHVRKSLRSLLRDHLDAASCEAAIQNDAVVEENFFRRYTLEDY